MNKRLKQVNKAMRERVKEKAKREQLSRMYSGQIDFARERDFTAQMIYTLPKHGMSTGLTGCAVTTVQVSSTLPTTTQ